MDRLVQYKPSAEQILDLENQLSTAFHDQFDAVEQTYTRFATVVPMDERGLIFGWLTSDDDLEEFDPNVGRVIKNLEAHSARAEVKKYHKTVGVTFDDIRDGKFSLAVLQATGIGRSTKRHPDRLTYGVLSANSMCLYDGKSLFADDHPVNVDDPTKGTFSNQLVDAESTAPYRYYVREGAHAVLFGVRNGENYSFGTLGADSETGFMRERIAFGVRARVVAVGGLPQFVFRSNLPMTPENEKAIIAAMEAIVGPEGQPIQNSPTLCIVPKSLRFVGKELFGSNTNATGGFNSLGGAVDLLVSDYL